MGYNTGVLILNDAADQITENLERWWNDGVLPHINSGGIDLHRLEGKRTVDVPAGNHCNGSTVFHVDHADNHAAYIIGGNRVQLTGAWARYGGYVSPEELQLTMLKNWADQMGYRLVKKAKK
jgi:hypothetical protein